MQMLKVFFTEKSIFFRQINVFTKRVDFTKYSKVRVNFSRLFTRYVRAYTAMYKVIQYLLHSQFCFSIQFQSPISWNELIYIMGYFHEIFYSEWNF